MFLPSLMGFDKAGFGTPLLLDTYPNAAAAYSLRKLRTAYTGNAIRVRRTDLTESNIGFTAAGNLDTAALLSFTGTGALDNGFITTWYDQSGNSKDAIQTTAISQPLIVSAGVLLTLNSKSAIRFDGSNDNLNKTSFGFPTTKISTVKVNNRIGSSQNYDSIGYNPGGGMINANEGGSIGFLGRPSGGSFFNASSGFPSTNNQILQLNIYDGSNLKASTNGNGFGTASVISNPIVYGNQILNIGSGGNNADYGNGNTQELVIWAVDQTTNKLGIETNINTYYGIY
jgi:hypothetical protein